MIYLRQSTASQSVLIGPFVDDTDGATAETGLTIANTDIRLSKEGANIVAKNSGGGTHDEIGYYTITFDATDTNTVGALQLMVDVTGALPVYHEFQVLEEATYDFLFDGGATPLADINAQCDTAISDAALATAANLATVDSNVDAILVDTGTTLPATLSTIDTNVDAILVDTGTDIPARFDGIEGATFSSSTDSLEAIRDRGDAAWTTGGGGSAPTAGEVADAVWDEARSGHTTAGTFGETMGTVESNIDNLDGTVSSRASQTSLDTVDSNVDAILVDTGTTIPGLIATAQADLDTITGSDGATLATTQGAITWGAVTISVTDAIDNITLAGSGTGDGLVFTRSGSGGLFGTNWASALESEVTDALTAYAPATEAKQDIIDTNVDSILVDTGTTLPATLATLPTNAEVNAEVVDVLETDTHAEPSSVVGATSSIKDAIMWVKTLMRNRMTQTSTTTTLRNDANTGNISTSTVSDDGTTFVRGKHT